MTHAQQTPPNSTADVSADLIDSPEEHGELPSDSSFEVDSTESPKPKIDFAAEVTWWFTAAARMRAHWDEHSALYTTAAHVLDGLPVISTDVSPSGVCVSIAGTKADLTAAFKALRSIGFNINQRPGREKTDSWNGVFRHPSGAQLDLIFSSTQCRRVSAGVKLVEVEQFDIVCDDEASAEDAP